jgi:hypothetical protein
MKKICGLVAVSFAIFFAQQAGAKDICLGTFSSLSFNSEGGDVQGVEIKVVYTRVGKQAAIQISEGEPGPLVIVPVVCDGTHLSLKIPKDDGRAAASFEGVVSKGRLVGELVYESGGREKLLLPRRKGYWD